MKKKDKTKTCTVCGLTKHITSFPTSRIGRKGQKIRKSNCAICEKKRISLWKHNNRDVLSDKAARWKHQNPIKSWCISTKANHRRRGNIINITTLELFEFAKEKKMCAICGDALNWEPNIHKKIVSNSPSLDRTNNEMILNLSNIQIVCYRCNASKGSRTMQEFIDYCKQVIKYHEELK
jgi:hypothetical protein